VACTYCCLANGFLGVDYGFLDGRHCTCS
jgi:hypothetical protein